MEWRGVLYIVFSFKSNIVHWHEYSALQNRSIIRKVLFLGGLGGMVLKTLKYESAVSKMFREEMASLYFKIVLSINFSI